MELNEPIEKYVRKNIVVLNYTESVRNIAEIMKQKQVGSVLIEKDKKIVGIITERYTLFFIMASFNSILI
jgi:predicted transcriptional regulator